MLFEHLDALGPDDLLLLDRGSPANGLLSVLNRHRIAFCLRVDKSTSGLDTVQAFRTALTEQRIILPVL